jgi:hypothetical protein
MHLIGKPFTYAELASKVRRLLDGGHFRSPPADERMP